MASRASAKEGVLMSTTTESAAPNFLRRKKSQGNVQFEQQPDYSNQ